MEFSLLNNWKISEGHRHSHPSTLLKGLLVWTSLASCSNCSRCNLTFTRSHCTGSVYKPLDHACNACSGVEGNEKRSYQCLFSELLSAPATIIIYNVTLVIRNKALSCQDYRSVPNTIEAGYVHRHQRLTHNPHGLLKVKNSWINSVISGDVYVNFFLNFCR
jgi:hypothetical protein